MQPENIFNGPIPGQSLTQDPDSRGPWEMPPKFSNPNQAIDHLFRVVTSTSFIRNLDTILQEDKQFYLDEIASSMVEEGFMNGLWTPDIGLLIIEPLIIMLVWASAQLNRSPTFSNDTGYEDRTGYENLTGAVMDAPEGPVEEQVEPEEFSETTPSPLVSNIPQSPLTGGL